MQYRQFGDAYYVRIDKDEEIVSSLRALCNQKGIRSATFSGIGGCQEAEIQVFDSERGLFDTECVHGMLELVALTGNFIFMGEGDLAYHAHALFSYRENGEHRIAAGHLKSATVLYTAEIELRPVMGGTIGALHDDVTNTSFWNLEG